MSLREEIAESVKSYLIRNKFEVADECINKVLDAAVEAGNKRLEGISNAQTNKRDKMSMIVAGNDIIEAIQRLKEGK